MNELPYRYKIVYEVIVAGDGQHVGGNGATETMRRLSDNIAADPNVVEVRTPGGGVPQYMARMRDG